MVVKLTKLTTELCTIEKIKISASRQKEKINIHPAQDFVRGLMWYGTKLNNVDYIINSEKQYIPLMPRKEKAIDENNNEIEIEIDFLKDNNIIVPFKTLTSANFSPDGLIRFLDGDDPNPSDIHNRIKRLLKAYTYFADVRFYDFLPCWIMGTYVFMCFNTYPYLHFQGEKASGKTTLFNVVSPLCFNALSGSNISKASFYRHIETNKSTMLVDEFEKFQDTMDGDAISILNSGYKKDGKVVRCEGKDFIPKQFSMYSPKMFAGINDVFDVLNDRCIRVNMYKVGKDDNIIYFKMKESVDKYYKKLRDDLYIFGLKYAKQINDMYTKEILNDLKPSILSPREWELWEPIYILSKIVNEDVFSAVAQYSIISSVERKDDNNENNFAYKFVKCFIEAVQRMIPIEIQVGNKYYDRNTLLNNIKLEDDEFSRYFTKMNSFTSYLKKKINIKETDHPFTRNNKTVKTIGIPDGFLEKLAEQFSLSSINQANVPNNNDPDLECNELECTQEEQKEIIERAETDVVGILAMSDPFENVESVYCISD